MSLKVVGGNNQCLLVNEHAVELQIIHQYLQLIRPETDQTHRK